MTLEDLASRVGKTTRTLRRWEADDLKKPISRNNLDLLASAMGVDVDQLMMTGAPLATQPDIRPAPPQPFHGPLRRKGVHVYVVDTNVVEGAGVTPGREIFVDQSVPKPASIPAGHIVVVRTLRSGLLLLRQFLPPSLVTTNRSSGNEAYRLEESGLVLAGVVMPDDTGASD